VIPPGTDPIAWTEDKQFQAALTRIIQGYSPSNITDTTTIRRNMQELSDSMEGGFYKYQQEFTRLHAELLKAGQPPDDRDLIEWIKKGIANVDVKKFMAQFFYTGAPHITSDDLFSRIREYLQFLMLSSEPIDPYKIISGSHNAITAKISQLDINNTDLHEYKNRHYHDRTRRAGKDKTPISTKSEKRCTRCWFKGHSWSECHSKRCAVCGHSMNPNMTHCPDYNTHTEPGTNWIHESSVKTTGNTTNPPGSNEKDLRSKREAVKEARKAYRSAHKASKRQKL